MKFFAVSAVLVAVAAADFNSWQLPDLSMAIQNPDTNPDLHPAMQRALNNVIDSIDADRPVTQRTKFSTTPTLRRAQSQDGVGVIRSGSLQGHIPDMKAHWLDEANHQALGAVVPGDLNGWALQDLSFALQNPETDPDLVPYLEKAINKKTEAIRTGIPVNPETDPDLVPYLERAINKKTEAIRTGIPVDDASAGLAPVKLDAPVKPDAVVVPSHVPGVEFEASAVTSPDSTAPSPLVKVIVNIQH